MTVLRGVKYCIAGALLAIAAGCGRSRPAFHERFSFDSLSLPAYFEPSAAPYEAAPAISQEDADKQTAANAKILNQDLTDVIGGKLRAAYFRGKDPESGLGFERLVVHNPKTKVTATYSDQCDKQTPLDGNLDSLVVRNYDGSTQELTGKGVHDRFGENYGEAVEQTVRAYADGLSAALKKKGESIGRKGNAGSVTAADGTLYSYSIRKDGDKTYTTLQVGPIEDPHFLVLDDDSDITNKILTPVIEKALQQPEQPEESPEAKKQSYAPARSYMLPVAIASSVILAGAFLMYNRRKPKT